MKTFQTSVICLFGACWLAISTPADGENSMDNSSRGIVGHNSFDLKPAPAAAAQDAQTPPPKIILNGIMTAFGDRSALFKVVPPQTATGKQFYFLSEGERAGDIELLSVDVKTCAIKIRNHGVIQIIALCQPPRLLSSPGAAAPAGSGGINRPDNQGFLKGNGQMVDEKTSREDARQFSQMEYADIAGMPVFPTTRSSANNNNTGSQNTGTANTGTANTGTANTGTANSGTANSGTANSGTANSGTANSGTANAGTAGSGTASTSTANSGNADTGIADPGAANTGTANTGTANTGTADPGTQEVEPFWVRASQEFEQLRIQTADAVRSGVDEPIPLTPLTPAGTPAELIGPDQAWFAND
jgi:hypothetical protein